MTNDPYALATDAATALKDAVGVASFDVALVMGSGWVPAADAIGETIAEIPVTDLPGFTPPAVAGHAGRIRAVRAESGKTALIFLGRTHLYEGRGAEGRSWSPLSGRTRSGRRRTGVCTRSPSRRWPPPASSG